jgi:tRNA G10  N-methylase Trm11
MKQFFILGRNPQLSKAEIFSYLDAGNIEFEQVLFKENFLILNLREEINLDIQNFGGIIMLGKIIFSGERKELLEFVKKDEIIPEDKFSFNLLGNYDIEQEIYEKFKSEKRKAQVKHGRGQIKMQDGNEFEMPNADFHLFCFKHNKIYFGLVKQVFSYKEIKNRDMKKPVRREELAISPRLANILINLSQATKNKTILDSFCGVGGIMQEALIREINCYGIDKDKQAIIQAKQNLEWLKKNYKIKANYELKNDDARNTPLLNFDAIATEPNLGELIRKKQSNFEAQKFIKKFEDFIIPLLQRLKKAKKPQGKIAITFPCIKNYSCNINKILGMTGLKISKIKDISFPIKEFRQDQFVSREVFVFE